MVVTGRGGVNLRDAWREAGGASAFLGITVPHFPNLFMCYGPSTNLAHGGSIIFHSECQVRYIMQAVAQLLRATVTAGVSASHTGVAIECTQDAHDAYNAELAPVLKKTVFQADCGTRYKDANGNVTGNSPWRLIDYFQRTQHLDTSHYALSVVDRQVPPVSAAKL
jgi:4-hydroxyacetophenone monooxygenase